MPNPATFDNVLDKQAQQYFGFAIPTITNGNQHFMPGLFQKRI
jgi:hypothetical protein